MCDKAVLENGGTSSLFLIGAKFTKCAIKQLIITPMH